MTMDINSKSIINDKDNVIVELILKYIEILLRIAVPIVAIFYLILKIFHSSSISNEIDIRIYIIYCRHHWQFQKASINI
jgi:hypothetical protein